MKTKPPKGMFAVTNPQHDIRELDEWKKWFGAKGIKTEVIQNNKGFVLCREGMEAKERWD